MSNEKQVTKDAKIAIERIFEQPDDAISFYCELGQIFGTGNEIMLQLYETIPGPPDPKGRIERVRTRLRATVTLSFPHAANIGNMLVKKTKIKK